MSEYFPEPKSSGGSVKFELELFNYATKADLKNATGVDTSKFAKKIGLANLKFDVDKLDIDHFKNVPNTLSNLKSKVDKLDVSILVPVPVDLIKLTDVVKIDVVKKYVYNAKIKNIEDEIPDIINLATNTTLNAKINEVKSKIPNITNVATTALTAVENKLSNVSNSVKKTNCNTKIRETENKITTDHDRGKYISTQKFNKLTAQNFALRVTQENLTSKNNIVNFVKKQI